MQRREWLMLAMASLGGHAWALPPIHMQFPRDLGSHPGFGTEWWYITGRAVSGTREFGFQLTFFRSRVEATQAMASRFAAKQLLFAHAAITDVQGKKLWHDQRIARAGFGIAEASETDTAVRLRDWSLVRTGEQYIAELPAQDFGLYLQLAPTQPLLLQGSQGLSRKGPQPDQASYYVSQPQLAASGHLQLQGQRFEIKPSGSRAWLDHEWSNAYLAPEAAGWDWLGMNLQDGSALTAFRIRRKDGGTLWDGGSFRTAQGALTIFQPGELRFTPERVWTSPANQARYPVEWTLDTPLGRFNVQAVIDNQELDSRQSTGAVYWEGLSRLLDAQGRLVGHGYLEMTGYAGALRM
ncbi:Predicted secreted hydrolase [Rhodoferax sp. OV413]|uniref:lipocalin-like domain-containing protein n=1 Tax=Rhodoferax sp. OV413 TaxID=1855285 RepID=UPI00088CC27D|nr:carotenoid 1,2-hydratase [Rhodoferax sp. OV413]SDO18844.1 Predicted secreted hydrolase [Rhodoferax sp. OV413]